jgi:hypothetical protein
MRASGRKEFPTPFAVEQKCVRRIVRAPDGVRKFIRGRGILMRRSAVVLSALVAAFVAVATPTPALAAGPTAIGVDSAGVVYVGFANGGQIKRYAGTDGAPLAPWGTPGSAAGQIGGVVAIDVAPGGSGNVWILDTNRRVQEFTRAGQFVRGIQLGACGGGITANPLQRGGLDVSNDSVYVVHPCANSILRLQLSNLQTMATASLTQPKGVSSQLYGTAPAGTVATYIARPAANLVQLLNPSGFSQLATKSTPSPADVFIDAFGVLFSADTANDRIHLYGSDGNEFRTLGSPGSAAGQLNDPMAFDVFEQYSDLAGNLFIADYANNRIQRWNPFGFTFWTAPASDVPGGPSAPVSNDPPQVTGTAAQGQTVTCSTGGWDNNPTSFAYQWLRNGAPIGGATSAPYTIVAADVGQQLACTVTATNAGGSGQATSPAVTPVSGAQVPVNTIRPAISGAGTPGNPLSCTTGVWDNNPTSYSIEWRRDGAAVATGNTYFPTQADVGHVFTCAVTATNAAGSSTVVTDPITITSTPGCTTGAMNGVSINAGATFTNSPGVTLTIHEPAGATRVIITNDGGFAAAGSTSNLPVSCNDEYSWTLESTGSERLPKTVYVRFTGGGVDPDKTFTDDIVLDETAPLMRSASLRSAQVAPGSSTKTRYVLSVSARDSNAGVAKIQTASSTNAARQTTYRYRSTLRLRFQSSARYVRAIDRAGNVGKWKQVTVRKVLSH